MRKAVAKLDASQRVLGLADSPEFISISPQSKVQSGVSEFKNLLEYDNAQLNLTCNNDSPQNSMKTLDNEAKLEKLKQIIGRATMGSSAQKRRDIGFSQVDNLELPPVGSSIKKSERMLYSDAMDRSNFRSTILASN